MCGSKITYNNLCSTKSVDPCQQLYVENQAKAKIKYKTVCY